MVGIGKMNLEYIGKRIKEKRIEKSWSQEVLAYEADLSTIYIGMIERGEKLPRLETFLRILECLDVTPNEILVDAAPDKHAVKTAAYRRKFEQLSVREQNKMYKILDAFLEE